MGSSPRRARCDGVRGMSERSSFGRNRGYSATNMFIRKNNRIMRSNRSGYVWYWTSRCNLSALDSCQQRNAIQHPNVGFTHYDLKMPPKNQVAASAPPLQRIFFMLRSSKIAAFCRLTISFRRGCRHFPGV